MTTTAKSMNRRAILRTLVVTIGAAAVGRAIAACSDGATAPVAGTGTTPTPTPKPNDQDEHVPGTSPPVNAGDDLPKVPNQVWEARVKQLEAEQTRLYARGPFVRGDAGVMSGKENSHEPKASIVTLNGKSKVQITVEHVMGKNALDAGVSDAGVRDAAADAADASLLDAGDAGDAGGPRDAAPAVIHFITTVFLRATVNGVDTVVGLWEFNATDAAPPTVQFTLPAGVTSVSAYEWCTLHGLWKASPLAI